MHSKSKNDSQDSDPHIGQIEAAFLKQLKNYTSGRTPYLELVAFCVDIVLHHKAARFVNQQMYSLICQIAILSRETEAIQARIDVFLVERQPDDG